VRQVVAYRTVPAAGEGGGAHRLASLVRNGSVDAIVFASPSAVRFASGVAEALRDAGDLAPVVVSMGPATTRAAAALGVLAVEPPNQAVGALVETLEELLAPSRVAEPV
jgi:uroporphyrinogen-III synthase